MYFIARISICVQTHTHTSTHTLIYCVYIYVCTFVVAMFILAVPLSGKIRHLLTEHIVLLLVERN